MRNTENSIPSADDKKIDTPCGLNGGSETTAKSFEIFEGRGVGFMNFWDHRAPSAHGNEIRGSTGYVKCPF